MRAPHGIPAAYPWTVTFGLTTSQEIELEAVVVVVTVTVLVVSRAGTTKTPIDRATMAAMTIEAASTRKRSFLCKPAAKLQRKFSFRYLVLRSRTALFTLANDSFCPCLPPNQPQHQMRYLLDPVPRTRLAYHDGLLVLIDVEPLVGSSRP